MKQSGCVIRHWVAFPWYVVMPRDVAVVSLVDAKETEEVCRWLL